MQLFALVGNLTLKGFEKINKQLDEVIKKTEEAGKQFDETGKEIEKSLTGIEAHVDKLDKQVDKVVQNLEKVLEKPLKYFEANKQGLKAVGGGLAAFGSAVAGAVALSVKTAASVEGTKIAFEGLAKAAGQSGDAIVSAMQKASAGTISTGDLMLSASRAMTMGVADSVEEFTSLMEIARDRGTAMGISTADAFDYLSNGIGRLSPRMLQQLGMVIDTSAAYAEYALSVGKSVTQLTEAEKKQAMYNAVLEKGASALGTSGKTSLTAAEALDSLKASISDLMAALGETFLPMVRNLASWLASIVRGFQSWSKENPGLSKTLTVLGTVIGVVAGALGAMTFTLPLVASGIKLVGAAAKVALGPIGWIVIAVEALVAAITVIVANWSKISGWFKGLFGIKDEAKETAEAVGDLNDETKELAENAEDVAASLKAEADALANVLDMVKKVVDAYDYSETAAGRYGLTLEDIVKYLRQQGYELEQIEALVAEYGTDANAILDAVGRTAREVAKATAVTVDQMLSNIERYTKDAKALAQDRYKAEKDKLTALSRDYQDWHKEQLAMISDELNARLSAIDAELAATVEGYQSQIRALEDSQRGDDRSRRDAEDSARLADIDNQLRIEKDWDKVANLRAQRLQLLADIEERHAKEARDDEKLLLQDKIAEARKTAQTEKDIAKEKAEAERASLEDRLADTMATYDAMESAANAQMELELANYDNLYNAYVHYLDDKLRDYADYVNEHNKLAKLLGGEAVVDPTNPTQTLNQRLENMGVRTPTKIPGLASGGIVQDDIIARIGENAPAVKEAVIPLTDDFLSKIGGGDVNIHIDINGATIGSQQDVTMLADEISRRINRDFQRDRRNRGV